MIKNFRFDKELQYNENLKAGDVVRVGKNWCIIAQVNDVNSNSYMLIDLSNGGVVDSYATLDDIEADFAVEAVICNKNVEIGGVY